MAVHARQLLHAGFAKVLAHELGFGFFLQVLSEARFKLPELALVTRNHVRLKLRANLVSLFVMLEFFRLLEVRPFNHWHYFFPLDLSTAFAYLRLTGRSLFPCWAVVPV